MAGSRGGATPTYAATLGFGGCVLAMAPNLAPEEIGGSRASQPGLGVGPARDPRNQLQGAKNAQKKGRASKLRALLPTRVEKQPPLQTSGCNRPRNVRVGQMSRSRRCIPQSRPKPALPAQHVGAASPILENIWGLSLLGTRKGGSEEWGRCPEGGSPQIWPRSASLSSASDELVPPAAFGVQPRLLGSRAGPGLAARPGPGPRDPAPPR